MFNGTYTICNLETGGYRTFSVKTQAADATFAPGKRVAALLAGPDNESDFRGFAFVAADQWGADRVWLWKRFQPTPGGSLAHYHFARMLEGAAEALKNCAGFGGEVEAAEATFTYEGKRYAVKASKRCARCNRKLTTPDSLARGVGPECAAILNSGAA